MLQVLHKPPREAFFQKPPSYLSSLSPLPSLSPPVDPLSPSLLPPPHRLLSAAVPRRSRRIQIRRGGEARRGSDSKLLRGSGTGTRARQRGQGSLAGGRAGGGAPRLPAPRRGGGTRNTGSGAREQEREGEAATVGELVRGADQISSPPTWGRNAIPDLAREHIVSLPEVPEAAAADLGVATALGDEADARVRTARVLRATGPCAGAQRRPPHSLSLELPRPSVDELPRSSAPLRSSAQACHARAPPPAAGRAFALAMAHQHDPAGARQWVISRL